MESRFYSEGQTDKVKNITLKNICVMEHRTHSDFLSSSVDKPPIFFISAKCYIKALSLLACYEATT